MGFSDPHVLQVNKLGLVHANGHAYGRLCRFIVDSIPDIVAYQPFDPVQIAYTL